MLAVGVYGMTDRGSVRDGSFDDLPRHDENPYEDIDLNDLPDWWCEAIEEFRKHGLRPFRPARFEDSTLKFEVVSELERELGINMRFVGVDVRYGDNWTVEVDGDVIGTIPRRRDSDGYTVFEMTADEFETWIRAQIDVV
jgi:hypothetical protein